MSSLFFFNAILITTLYIIVMVNFMCQLVWAKGMPGELAKHYFWVCMWECFWKRLTFESIDWVKKTWAHHCGQAPSDMLRALILEQKGGGRAISLSLFLSWVIHLLLPSDIRVPGSSAFGLGLGVTPSAPLVLRVSASDWIILPAFLIMQLEITYHGTSQPP